MNNNDGEDIDISWEDLKKLFQRHEKKMKRLFICFMAVILILLIFKPQTYHATASFKQSSSRGDQINSEFKNFLKEAGFQSGMEVGAMPVMLSNTLIKSVASELGLQVRASPFHWISNLLFRLKSNGLRELGLIAPERQHFKFSKVDYLNERTGIFYLHFLSKDSFEILDEKKTVLKKGAVNQITRLESWSFCLDAVPENLNFKKDYLIKVSPWPQVVDELKKNLRIKISKLDKNVLQMTFKAKQRDLAARFLNHLMFAYQKYLKNENEQLTHEQLVYLEQRQEELGRRMEKTLEEHAGYLRKNLGDNGFIGLNQEIEILAIPKEEYVSRLFDIDLELKRLQHSKTARSLAASERFKRNHGPSRAESIPTFFKQQQNYEKQLLELDFLNPRQNKQSNDPHLDLEGIDLESARKQISNYNVKLDEIQAQIGELLFVSQRLMQPNFELSSLSSVLTDQVSHEMLKTAGQIALQLQDEENRSGKEQLRLKDSLTTQKKFILQHISQLIELARRRQEHIQEKLSGLQDLSIELIQNEKQLLHEKLMEIKHRMHDLPEKWRLENKLKLKAELGKGVMEGMSQLVEIKNIKHHLFQVESKPLDLSLVPVKSQYPYLLLISLLGALCATALFFGVHVFKSLLHGFPVSLQGLRRHQLLTVGELSDQSDCSIDTLVPNDLETLRNMAVHLAHMKKRVGKSVICLIGGRGPDYSRNVARLLAKQGFKTIIVRSDFGSVAPCEGRPGLCEYLEDDLPDCPVVEQKDFDWIPVGKASRFGFELLSSVKFQSLLQKLQSNYDFVLLFNNSEVSLAENRYLANQSDFVLLSVSDESLEQLRSFKHDLNCACSFIVCP